MFEITDRIGIENMINHATDDIESILKTRPVLEKMTLCHIIASTLAWDALEMADSEMASWCVERGRASVKEWFDNYEYKASFVKSNLCDSMIMVWEDSGIREKINERVKSLCYAICGKVPERLDFAGVLSFRLFGDVMLSLPEISMEKFFEKKILPVRLCNKALFRRFVPFFSREYVYRSFENSKYFAYLKICNKYEAHFMRKEYNSMILPEYISFVVESVSKELIYDQLCLLLNIKKEGEKNMKEYFGEYTVTIENGCIKLPEKWNIEGEIVLIGCGDHAEIMNKDIYDEEIKNLF